jgi:hypothetical protein
VLAVLNLADPGDNRDTIETIEALAGLGCPAGVRKGAQARAGSMSTALPSAEQEQRAKWGLWLADFEHRCFLRISRVGWLWQRGTVNPLLVQTRPAGC